MKKKIVITIGIIGLLFILLVPQVITVATRTNAPSRFRLAAQEYLEEKYGEEFVVGGMRNRGGGFAPDIFWRQRAGSIPQTSYFFAHPSADPNYVFRVFVTRQENSYRIAEIRDTYAWRFLREQLQEYAANYFLEALGIDTKVDVRLIPHGSFHGFPREIDHNTLLEDFLSLTEQLELRYRIHFLVFISHFDESIEDKIAETTRSFATRWYEMGEFGESTRFSSHIAVRYVNDIEIYHLIDPSLDFPVLRDYRLMHRRWDMQSPFWFPSFDSSETPEREALWAHFIHVYSISIFDLLEEMGEDYEYLTSS